MNSNSSNSSSIPPPSPVTEEHPWYPPPMFPLSQAWKKNGKEDRETEPRKRLLSQICGKASDLGLSSAFSNFVRFPSPRFREKSPSPPILRISPSCLASAPGKSTSVPVLGCLLWKQSASDAFGRHLSPLLLIFLFFSFLVSFSPPSRKFL